MDPKSVEVFMQGMCLLVAKAIRLIIFVLQHCVVDWMQEEEIMKLLLLCQDRFHLPIQHLQACSQMQLSSAAIAILQCLQAGKGFFLLFSFTFL